jgi:large subunit ribosomal protein L6
MQIRIADGTLSVERPSDERQHRSLHGLTRTLIANMVEGVTDGYQKVLEVHGVGYRAAMNGKNLTLAVGFSHGIEIPPPPGIEFEAGTDSQTRIPFIVIRGIDKQRVGQIAAQIRFLRKPEPYKGKGIRFRGEQIRRKAGKAGKAGGKGGKK